MTLEAHAGGGVFYDITLVLIETSWWGRISEAMLSGPKGIRPAGCGGCGLQGAPDRTSLSVLEPLLLRRDPVGPGVRAKWHAGASVVGMRSLLPFRD